MLVWDRAWTQGYLSVGGRSELRASDYAILDSHLEQGKPEERLEKVVQVPRAIVKWVEFSLCENCGKLERCVCKPSLEQCVH